MTDSLANSTSDVYTHLEHLCVDIGPRPTGSAGQHAAADSLARVFGACGLEVERQGFACPGWEAGAAQLEVAGEPLLVAANAYSHPCDVAAPLVRLCTLAELEQADLHGRIAVLYGELTQAPLAAKSWFLKGEREARMVELLEEKAPAALLTVQNRPGELERLVEDWEFGDPLGHGACPRGAGAGAWPCTRRPAPDPEPPVADQRLQHPWPQAGPGCAAPGVLRALRHQVRHARRQRQRRRCGGAVGPGAAVERARPGLRAGVRRLHQRGISAAGRRRIPAPGGTYLRRDSGCHQFRRRRQLGRRQHNHGHGGRGRIRRGRPALSGSASLASPGWIRGRRATIPPSPGAACPAWRAATPPCVAWRTCVPIRSTG